MKIYDDPSEEEATPTNYDWKNAAYSLANDDVPRKVEHIALDSIVQGMRANMGILPISECPVGFPDRKAELTDPKQVIQVSPTILHNGGYMINRWNFKQYQLFLTQPWVAIRYGNNLNEWGVLSSSIFQIHSSEKRLNGRILKLFCASIYYYFCYIMFISRYRRSVRTN